MKREKLGWILALALCLGFVSMEVRGDGASRPDLQRFFAQLQRDAEATPAARKPAKPTRPTGEKAYCEAQCGGGATVSVNCSGTCTAVDRNCYSGQQGYAKCTGGSPVYCSDPCPCWADTPCPSGGWVGCMGYEHCAGGPGYCFAMCDENFYWCPGETGFLC